MRVPRRVRARRPHVIWQTTTGHETMRTVALLNIAYFGIEFAAALSGARFRSSPTSVDFLEDASIN